jgi:hypothetical protein
MRSAKRERVKAKKAKSQLDRNGQDDAKNIKVQKCPITTTHVLASAS